MRLPRQEGARLAVANRRHVSRRHRYCAVFAAALVAASCFFAFAAAPASAATFTNMSWSVSNNQVGATNVIYSYSFTPATTGVIKTITFAVSGAGLAGTPTISRNYGIGAGTVSRAGQTITYTVTSAVSVSAGVPIYLSFGGLTNTSTAGSYTTTITTQTAVPTTIDTGTTPAVTMSANNTAVTVAIAQSLTFSVNNTAFELDMDPSLASLADQTATVGLTVQTNANSGYTLAVADSATGLQSSGTGNPTIPKVSTGKATSLAWPGAPNWGYTVTGSGATIDPAFTGSKYAGYVSGGETIATRSGPTGGTADTITISNRVAINYSVTSGVYSDTVTYTVTPNYS
jgi:hypothetical protein